MIGGCCSSCGGGCCSRIWEVVLSRLLWVGPLGRDEVGSCVGSGSGSRLCFCPDNCVHCGC